MPPYGSASGRRGFMAPFSGRAAASVACLAGLTCALAACDAILGLDQYSEVGGCAFDCPEASMTDVREDESVIETGPGQDVADVRSDEGEGMPDVFLHPEG